MKYDIAHIPLLPPPPSLLLHSFIPEEERAARAGMAE